MLDKHYKYKVVKLGQCGGDNSALSAKVDTETDISITDSDIKERKKENKNNNDLLHTKKLEIILKNMIYVMATSA